MSVRNEYGNTLVDDAVKTIITNKVKETVKTVFGVGGRETIRYASEELVISGSTGVSLQQVRWMQKVAAKLLENDYGKHQYTMSNYLYQERIIPFREVLGDTLDAYATFAAMGGHPKLAEAMKYAELVSNSNTLMVKHITTFVGAFGEESDTRWEKMIDVMTVILNSGVTIDLSYVERPKQAADLWDEFGAELLMGTTELLKQGLSFKDVRLCLENGIDNETMLASR